MKNSATKPISQWLGGDLDHVQAIQPDDLKAPEVVFDLPIELSLEHQALLAPWSAQLRQVLQQVCRTIRHVQDFELALSYVYLAWVVRLTAPIPMDN